MNWIVLIFMCSCVLPSIYGFDINHKWSFKLPTLKDVGNFFTNPINSIKNFFKISTPEKIVSNIPSRIEVSYKAVFGAEFFDYYYPPNHTFIGQDVELFNATVVDSELRLDSVNHEVLPSSLNQISDYVDLSIGAETHHSGITFFGAQEVVYPKLTLIIEPALAKLFESVAGIIKYLIEFWMHVDLIFRQLSWPKVRLNIARIIILQTENVVSYLKKHFSTEGWQSINILMTSMTNNNEINERPFVDTLCTKDELHFSLPIGEAHYAKAVTALARLFGASSDLENASQFFKSLRFSSATKEKITKQFSDHHCFDTKPEVSHPIDISLPGMGIPLDVQCKNHLILTNSQTTERPKPMPIKNDDAICETLTCNNELITPNLPLDGTICNHEDTKICIRGKCVSLPEELKNNMKPVEAT